MENKEHTVIAHLQKDFKSADKFDALTKGCYLYWLKR